MLTTPLSAPALNRRSARYPIRVGSRASSAMLPVQTSLRVSTRGLQARIQRNGLSFPSSQSSGVQFAPMSQLDGSALLAALAARITHVDTRLAVLERKMDTAEQGSPAWTRLTEQERQLRTTQNLLLQQQNMLLNRLLPGACAAARRRRMCECCGSHRELRAEAVPRPTRGGSGSMPGLAPPVRDAPRFALTTARDRSAEFLSITTVFDRYKCTELCYVTSACAVFRARVLEGSLTGTDVAVKVALSGTDKAASMIGERDVLTKHLRTLSGKGVPNVLDFGLCGDASGRGGSTGPDVLALVTAPFGKPVKQAVKDWSAAEMRTFALASCVLLRRVHECGVLHGDITLSSLLVTAGNAPMLVDFGSACAAASLPQRAKEDEVVHLCSELLKCQRRAVKQWSQSQQAYDDEQSVSVQTA
jgi:hypothetical protein